MRFLENHYRRFAGLLFASVLLIPLLSVPAARADIYPESRESLKGDNGESLDVQKEDFVQAPRIIEVRRAEDGVATGQGGPARDDVHNPVEPAVERAYHNHGPWVDPHLKVMGVEYDGVWTLLEEDATS